MIEISHSSKDHGYPKFIRSIYNFFVPIEPPDCITYFILCSAATLIVSSNGKNASETEH